MVNLDAPIMLTTPWFYSRILGVPCALTEHDDAELQIVTVACRQPQSASSHANGCMNVCPSNARYSAMPGVSGRESAGRGPVQVPWAMQAASMWLDGDRGSCGLCRSDRRVNIDVAGVAGADLDIPQVHPARGAVVTMNRP